MTHKDLVVWKKGIQLVQEVYLITDMLPKSELYILVSQILRAAISIPSNIAEGYRRGHRLEYIRFLAIALASAAELETQLVILKNRYGSINCDIANGLLDEIQRLLYATIKTLKQK